MRLDVYTQIPSKWLEARSANTHMRHLASPRRHTNDVPVLSRSATAAKVRMHMHTLTHTHTQQQQQQQFKPSSPVMIFMKINI